VIAAVTRFGARGGFGVDISESAVAYANGKAAEQGVADPRALPAPGPVRHGHPAPPAS
jgi:hypothetical protein